MTEKLQLHLFLGSSLHVSHPPSLAGPAFIIVVYIVNVRQVLLTKNSH